MCSIQDVGESYLFTGLPILRTFLIYASHNVLTCLYINIFNTLICYLHLITEETI